MKNLTIVSVVIFGFLSTCYSGNLTMKIYGVKSDKMAQIRQDLEAKYGHVNGENDQSAIEVILSSAAQRILDEETRERIYKNGNQTIKSTCESLQSQISIDSDGAVADNYGE